ncbi:succinate--CoA ligase subunit alpha [Candidatus Methylacidithermus pantelleriae]|uniref:Succinate--CoA ligase [ADP-forming] subunit alpha n=1 Tax=Candidatus Methylacidithermus pantelleriae TaxID=2744239 RepID=A0A8J2FX72_9BACT|nr:succinate--CoA ligase subunit alpha [Candidatus Methylacidithermus pantelleriae]CAF0703615.1 Succinyl-CoA synthetase, alpha subunit [Candidatus Methylacidithermus pantelleriae]
MAILVNAETRVVVQGITGRAGSFHTRACLEYGTKIVAGVTPGKGGRRFDGKIPIFDTVEEAKESTGCNASLIFVPAQAAPDAILEAGAAGLDLVVCITEGIRVHDMMRVRWQLQQSHTLLLGPNTPGIISPGQCKIGIMPGYIHRPGPVGVVSRSGTLTYEAVWQATLEGLGQSTCLGVGGDPIHGMSLGEALFKFMEDPQTEAILLLGEIGGGQEEEVAKLLSEGRITKPVAAFIAGSAAPSGRRMGHAGAIVFGESERARTKMERLEAAGAWVIEDPSKIGKTLRRLLRG